MPPIVNRRQTYEHLKLALEPFKLPFSGFGGGPKPPTIPAVPDRGAHAGRLSRNLEAIVGERQAGRASEVPEDEAGYHLTVRARTRVGVQPTGSVPEMLSIKGEGKDQRVNLFVRAQDLDTFRKRIGAYADNDGTGSRKPANFKLFESASEFAPTRLEDLWTDAPEAFPEGAAEARWEAWVRPAAVQRVRSFAGRYGVECEPGQADFPSVSVLRVRARAKDLSRFVDATSAVLELRACSSLTLEHLSLPASSQRRLAAGAAARVVAPPEDAPRVCILDSGVQASHTLLAPALSPADCHTLNDAWERLGWHPHGTRVAGLALYGDFEGFLASSETLRLTTRLESCVVLRPPTSPAATLESVGEIVAAVGLLEDSRSAKRVYCLAASDYRGLNDGSPNKLSGSIDQLAWGLNGRQRLFCVAAGNIQDDPLFVAGYPGRNQAVGISSPGQSLNALTVGGCTFRDEHPHGGRLLCDTGDLSPSARTSRPWTVRSATKPDLVYEAGNRGVPAARGETASERMPELDPLTTNNERGRPLATLGETSGATAAVAGMAARVMAQYPDYWPETVRGLLVHSSSWTPAMLARGKGLGKDDANELLLSLFGWGVPDEGEAMLSASDRLTLVIEGSLVPFRLEQGQMRINECAYHPLPWPSASLRALGSTEVELRITLSYFVEPDMRTVAARKFQNYPSHRLAFDLKGPEDDPLDVVRRQNKRMTDVRTAKPPARSERNWRIAGALRERGTIHHDTWIGPAEDLAGQDAIRVSPIGGWWRDHPDHAGVAVRYALVVSVRTPGARQDIYQEALAAVPVVARTRIAALERHAVRPVTVVR